MRNAGLDESQAGTRIAWRNINNIIYADDTTLMAEREDEQKGLLVNKKEKSEKASLKLSIQNMKIMASDLITSWQTDEEKCRNSDRFHFSWAAKSPWTVTAAMKLNGICSLEQKLR